MRARLAIAVSETGVCFLDRARGYEFLANTPDTLRIVRFGARYNGSHAVLPLYSCPISDVNEPLSVTSLGKIARSPRLRDFLSTRS